MVATTTIAPFQSLPEAEQERYHRQAMQVAEEAAGRSLAIVEYSEIKDFPRNGMLTLPMRPVTEIVSVMWREPARYDPLYGSRPPGEWHDLNPTDCHVSPNGQVWLPVKHLGECQITYAAGWDLHSPQTRSAVSLAGAVEAIAECLYAFDSLGANNLPTTFRVEGEVAFGYGKEAQHPARSRYELCVSQIKQIVRAA